MQATEIDRSPGLPSSMVTTRRRLMPHGTSCSFLQAVTQALHSMQRSASQRNFALAMFPYSLCCADLAESGLRLLHLGDTVIAIGLRRVRRLAQDIGVGPVGVLVSQVLALEMAAEMEGHEDNAFAHPLGDHGHDLDLGALGALDPDLLAVPHADIVGVARVDFHEHVLLKLGQPRVRTGLVAAA